MANKIESAPKPESNSENFEVVPAEGEKSEFFKNCLVIKEGAKFSSPAEIAHLAIQHEAFEDSSDDEAGDDLYLVQFPGYEQESLRDDQLSERLREFNEKS